MTGRDDGAGQRASYEELLREQADRLNHLKVMRGAPSLRVIEARARKLFGDQASLSIATQHAAFKGNYVGVEKLFLLVRTLLSWNEYGEELDSAPGHRSGELEEWRQRWTAIAMHRQRRGRASATETPDRPETAGQGSPQIPSARDPEHANVLAKQMAALSDAKPTSAKAFEEQDHEREAEHDEPEQDRNVGVGSLSIPELLEVLFLRAPMGQVVSCTVTGMSDDAVLVHLAKGVPGIIELDKLRSPAPQKSSDVVKVGDEVFAVIKEVVLSAHYSKVVELSVVDADLALGDDPETVEFDATLYGMPAEYDSEGDYIFPDGFDGQTNEWLPGFDKARREWEHQYEAAEKLFERHKRHVLAQRATSGPGDSQGERDSQASGVVKWFNPEKGFGFISVDVGPDVFLHYSKIEMEGFRVLEEGQRVQFVHAQGKRGPEAHHVRPIDS